MEKKTTIIAEAGVNHNGDINNACKLIKVASDAGADFVKFQSFNPNNVVIEDAPKAEYQIKNTKENESQLNMIKRFYLNYEEHRTLLEHCRKNNIGFFSTAFDIESLDMLINLGLKMFKIPSGEITNYPLLKKIAYLNKTTIMSTGMASITEIEAAINTLYKYGIEKKKLIVLHCNTNYPTPVNEVNLKMMNNIKEKFNVRVGFSDHTMGSEISLAAVALGAEVIEKHFTMDRSLPGPDQKCSLEPDELKFLIQSIRNIEKSMGSKNKVLSKEEEKNKAIVRKSIVALKDIKKGEIFSELNITTKRPESGISPMRWNEIIGKKAKKNFYYNELIEL
ncbi:MAG: N-acetylneuraminate synthase [Candidatus Endolissoclinum sp. TMED37]|nr:MAG: N-acetylneuraminate synthase [Candidatus Endolissoclinum sp. TMED37]|tara:strand:- start:3975 stop:4982 length:1008 start_codon:yes stop_codon:yes gene_type:complete